MGDGVVLCGANSYNEKYYFNEKFRALPDEIQDELRIMCVSFTEIVGGVLTMEFNPEGELLFKVNVEDGDYLFDEIESGIQISRMQRKKEELLLKLETYYKIVFLKRYKDDKTDVRDRI